jgi:hypothetical protein
MIAFAGIRLQSMGPDGVSIHGGLTRRCSRLPSAREIVAILTLSDAARLGGN